VKTVYNPINTSYYEVTTSSKYYSLWLPLSLTDCVEACLYLSVDNIYVDIGLPFTTASDSIWFGICSAIRYDTTTNMCELISDFICTDDAFQKTSSVCLRWMFSIL
jgi:hypothetical protein